MKPDDLERGRGISPAPAYGPPPMGDAISDPTPSRYKVWRIIAAIFVVAVLAFAWWHYNR